MSGEALKQGAALWALNIELGPRTGDICHKGLRALKVAAHPCFDVAKTRVGGDHKEFFGAKFGDRQVGLDAAPNVKPLCVGDAFCVAIYVVGAEPVEQTSSIAVPVLLLPLLAFALAAFIIAMMVTLRVTVTRDDVAVQYGVFGPKIPIESIIECKAENYSLMKYGGYGIRLSPIDGSWAFNMLGDKGKAVRIHYKKKSGGIRKILIASHHHHMLADAINRQRLAHGHDVPASVPDEKELQVDDEVVFSGLNEDAEEVAHEESASSQKA